MHLFGVIGNCCVGGFQCQEGTFEVTIKRVRGDGSSAAGCSAACGGVEYVIIASLMKEKCIYF